MRFSFAQPQLYVRAGEQARIGVRIDAPLPSPGEQVERAFAVVCHDGTDESEATGSLVHRASASPITTAQIRLDPQHVVVRNSTRGRLFVTVDNSRGALPLSVWLSGTDPERAVRFTFTPRRLDMPPGGFGRARLDVSASLPGSGKEVVREIKVSAGDGVGVIDAYGRFSQSMSDILPILRLVLTLLGGLLVVLGAIRPWFSGVQSYSIGALLELQGQVRELSKAIQMRNAEQIEGVALTIWQPAARALMLVLAAVMLLGILGATGRATIRAGFAIAILMMLYILYAMIRLHSNWPAYGAQLVMLGAIIGIIGGFCIKRRGPP